jgi:hypothetical protein
MKTPILFTLILLTMQSTFGQFPTGVHAIDAQPNAITEFSGDLTDGSIMEDLSWASSSSNACFPATQNSKFRGSHVLHGFSIPPYSEVTITLIPKDKSKNFSLYGYQVGTTNFAVPPKLSSCVSCEADHKWDRPHKGKTQDHTRSIFFNSIKNPYNIFIGVAGAEGLNSGAYTLKIDLKSRIENTEAQQPLKVYSAHAEIGKTLAYGGDLNEGVKLQNLDWADNSSVACFPGTQNAKFTGNHLFFVTEIPRQSIMEITLIPEDKNANFSLYAYQDGTTSKVMPPELSSCVSCEADHKWDRPHKGKTQDHTRSVSLNAINNPYRVVIGVTGADGLSSGKFQIQIKTKAR